MALPGRGFGDRQAYLVDGVVGVAEGVPLRLVWLGLPGQVRGFGPDGGVAWPGEARGMKWTPSLVNASRCWL